MLQNAYLVVNIGANTAEKEPSKVLHFFLKIHPPQGFHFDQAPAPAQAGVGDPGARLRAPWRAAGGERRGGRARELLRGPRRGAGRRAGEPRGRRAHLAGALRRDRGLRRASRGLARRRGGTSDFIHHENVFKANLFYLDVFA